MKRKSKGASEMAKRRWAKTSKAERSAHARKMVEAREAKRQAEKAEAGSAA